MGSWNEVYRNKWQPRTTLSFLSQTNQLLKISGYNRYNMSPKYIVSLFFGTFQISNEDRNSLISIIRADFVRENSITEVVFLCYKYVHLVADESIRLGVASVGAWVFNIVKIGKSPIIFLTFNGFFYSLD